MKINLILYAEYSGYTKINNNSKVLADELIRTVKKWAFSGALIEGASYFRSEVMSKLLESLPSCHVKMWISIFLPKFIFKTPKLVHLSAEILFLGVLCVFEKYWYPTPSTHGSKEAEIWVEKNFQNFFFQKFFISKTLHNTQNFRERF